MSDLTSLMANLMFTEEDLEGMETLQFEEERQVEGSETWLVGKVIASSPIDHDKLLRVFKAIWKDHPLEVVPVLRKNMFLFKFGVKDDVDYALDRCPWTFHGNLLSLRQFDKLLGPQDYDFKALPIWTRVFNVPLSFMMEKVDEKLGNQMGVNIATDLHEGAGHSGEFMRTRVEIDYTLPLRRFIVVGKNRSWKPRIYPLQDERLPNFCYFCDDSLIFIKNSMTEAQRLKEVLQVCELSLGQKVNIEKSFIYYNKGINDVNKSQIRNIFLHARGSEGWTKQLLCYGGHEVLIKSLAQSLPTYGMSCFLHPECILNPIMRSIHNFWWSGNAKESV
ncbi:hypothetical protein GQ457_11G021010 [Hibiscus cannabinus]